MLTVQEIAAVLARLGSIWRDSEEMPAVRSAVREFREELERAGARNLNTEREFSFDSDTFTAASRLDAPPEDHGPYGAGFADNE